MHNADSKVILKPIKQKSHGIVKRNSNLLKGLKVSTVFALARLHVCMSVCFLCAMLGLDVAGSSRNIIVILTIGLTNTFALAATCAFHDAEGAPEDIIPEFQNIFEMAVWRNSYIAKGW